MNDMKRKYLLLFAFCFGLIFILTACAGPNGFQNVPDDVGKVAGFWKGLFNGMFILCHFIASWFTDVNIYEVHNNGFWYNLGYLFGLGCHSAVVVKRGD